MSRSPASRDQSPGPYPLAALFVYVLAADESVSRYEGIFIAAGLDSESFASLFESEAYLSFVFAVDLACTQRKLG